MVVLTSLLGVCAGLRNAIGQTSDKAAEMATQDTQPAFKLQVQRNLVLVRVIVRDSKGQAVSGLRKEDFRLFDNRKPQVVTHFSVETPSPKTPAGADSSEPKREGGEREDLAPAASAPQRYVALFFDDVHLTFEHVARTREAADRYLGTALQPGDRVGVFTSSGQTVQDFTDDRQKIHDALFKLLPRPVVPGTGTNCPQISDYQAYLIVEQHDQTATNIAADEAFECDCEPSAPAAAVQQCRSRAFAQAESEATQVLSLSQTTAEYSLRGLEQLVRRAMILPGQRNIVLVSPGFLTLTRESRLGEIIDRALRSSVVISTIDAKGLYAPAPLGDASQKVISPTNAALAGQKVQLQLDRINRAEDVMAELADSTGGFFFHNNNDLDAGFRKAGALPEVYYVLGFSPQDLKLDGRFHTLKVSLVDPARLTVQARRGYFAPRKSQDASAQADEEIEEVTFSQDQLNELPVDLRTQFFKPDPADAKLSCDFRQNFAGIKHILASPAARSPLFAQDRGSAEGDR